MFGLPIVGLKSAMAMRSEMIGLAILCWLFQGSGLWAQQDVEVVAPTVQQLEFFESKIRPVLVERCYECHSSGATILQANLSLETREGILRGGDSGPAVVVGKPEESLLIAVLGEQEPKMPPEGQLPEGLIADLKRWVEDGLVDPRVASDSDSSGGEKGLGRPGVGR